MKIQEWRFTNWCGIATSLIEFPPDRKEVAQELRNHLDDHCEALMERGMPYEEAAEKTLTSMGDPLDIAPQLAVLHRPFWGYFLRTVRIIVVVLLVLLLIPGWKFLCAQDFGLRNYAEVYWLDDGFTLTYSAETEASFTDSGYTFTVTKADVWQSDSEQRLYFYVEQTGPLPCSVAEDYSRYQYPAKAFWGQDDLGNYYYSMDTFSQGDLNIQAARSQTGIFTWTYECWINDLPAGISWIDIHYDRDGRDHILRIDLTGGAS